MAFGFPAYHTEDFEFRTECSDSKQLVKTAIEAQGWSLTGASEDWVTASGKVNWLSWGEKIRVVWLTDSKISITSKCSLPTQCFDWGHNKSNVLALITQIKLAEQDAARPPVTTGESRLPS